MTKGRNTDTEGRLSEEKEISLPVKIKKHLLHSGREASPCVRMEASYMAEFAVILPFFAGFMVFLLFFFRVLSVQQEVGNAMLAAGREMAAAECSAEEISKGAFTARTLVFKNLQKDSLAEQFIRGGRNGIKMAGSRFSGDYICLRADYCLRFPIGLFGSQEISVTQKIKCRKWTGSYGDTDAEKEIVFITPGGSVYHRMSDCTYLKPAIRRVEGDEITGLRNTSGGKYYPCIKCMKNKKPNNMMVYVTKYGDRFHLKADCSRIKRTVCAVRLSEVKNRPACSKCGRE